MAKPLPFTFSSLSTFANCPSQFHHLYVLKDVESVQSAEGAYGDDVHKIFQAYVESGGETPLRPDLKAHQPKLDQLLAKDGIFWCEEQVALGKDLKPCRYDDPDRLWRGKADFRLVDRAEQSATLVDYKTGKKHDKWAQLAIYAIHTFAMFPKVNLINAQFYWTKDCSTTKKVWGRDDIEELWDYFTGDLMQYKQAFKEDTWQTRPSGLCRGWCPVKKCQHWSPKRS